MAEVTKVHGNAGANEQVGRDIEWVQFTSVVTAAGDLTTNAGDPGSNLEILIRILSQYGTVTIQGTEVAAALTVGMEGLGGGGPTATDTAGVIAAIDAEITANAAFTSLVTASVTMSGDTWA